MSDDKTCREELLESIKQIVKSKGINEFTLDEAVNFMNQNGTKFKESTIRTHITSRCCKNAPDNHRVVYEDYCRIGQGVYRLLNL